MRECRRGTGYSPISQHLPVERLMTSEGKVSGCHHREGAARRNHPQYGTKQSWCQKRKYLDASSGPRPPEASAPRWAPGSAVPGDWRHRVGGFLFPGSQAAPPPGLSASPISAKSSVGSPGSWSHWDHQEASLLLPPPAPQDTPVEALQSVSLGRWLVWGDGATPFMTL